MPIKIGFLVPYSGIYPNMSQHIIQGMAHPFRDYQIGGQNQSPFVIEMEYIQQGGRQAVIDAVTKLIFFNQVDILMGVISYRIIPEIISVLEKHNKIGFFFDSGEYIPHTPQISPTIFYNSQQLWQTEYALGYWAQQEFGGKGSIAMSIYDAGYHLHSAFRQGTIKAGGKEIDYTVLGGHPEEGVSTSVYMDKYLEMMTQKPPDYIHAIFCGEEATQFMTKYYASPLRNKVPLVVSSHMASDEIVIPFNNFEWKVYSASTWNTEDSSPINQQFVQKYLQNTGQKPNFHTLLGYEVGLVFREFGSYFERRDLKPVIEVLQEKSIDTPRGEVNFYPKSGFALPTIDIQKVIFSQNSVSKIVINQGKGLKYDNQVFNEIHQENISGWYNPYFCV